ncbi:hypothetical protein LWP59_04535 [Amycolatopsis acidiphila]|uniref:Uncharacterized protein n=1 Tax=Amycolatopsis acidiphila TaxID=715473 RepID=A0A557ZN17_9PSEU|nr:hypothetical protein [Amycolatopsis acidiphila]TVT13393.1 hypothetical protein FNH06_39130 [Amycolatopsis acidiphila]UIJ60942.1 hypothetical protein LWP59_04535 [Amycolatopsis acidiphila]
MRAWAFVTFVSGVLIVLFLVLFSLPVHATPPGGQPIACGNGWTVADLPAKPVPQAGTYDRYFSPGSQAQADTRVCDRARKVRKAAGVLVLGLGVVGLCGAFLGRRATRVSRT